MGDNNIITHSGTANIGVTISATASGTVVSVHSGVASCQVNLSVSASGFNANTTVPDETSNGNNMTLYGDSVFSTDSAVGTRAVTFDGSGDYGVINDPLESTFQSPFSISMWVKPDDGQPSGDSGRLLSTWGGTSYTIVLIQSEHGNINMNFQLGGSARTNHTPTAVFTNGTQSSYTHLVCVVDSSATLTLYVNGNSTSVTSSGSGSLSDYSSSQNIAIGTHNPASPTDGTTFTGKIDDISIWNTELTSTQASNIYNSGSGTDLTGSSNLVGYWKMGDSNTITHSGTATVSVDVTASASGTTSTTHSGTASCQVNLSASASGSVVAGGFTISTFDTETNILASTPSDGTIAYGTDTESYYVYDSSLGWAEFIPS